MKPFRTNVSKKKPLCRKCFFKRSGSKIMTVTTYYYTKHKGSGQFMTDALYYRPEKGAGIRLISTTKG